MQCRPCYAFIRDYVACSLRMLEYRYSKQHHQRVTDCTAYVQDKERKQIRTTLTVHENPE